jgi:hypothetical protein
MSQDLIDEAWHAHRSGWDFSWLDGRTESTPTPWDYRERAQALVAQARAAQAQAQAAQSGRLLDIDTGGGEFLAALAPLPAGTVAIESWPPNVPVARDRLHPLGVTVASDLNDLEPPFDLVLNRHGRLDAPALAALTRPGAILLTQQVGSRNHLELNKALSAPTPEPSTAAAADAWTLDTAVNQLTRAGFQILDAREALLPFRFLDIGAIVYQLAAIPWQIPNFNPTTYAAPLRRLDAHLTAAGGLTVHDHRFLIEARRTRNGPALSNSPPTMTASNGPGSAHSTSDCVPLSHEESHRGLGEISSET